MKNNPIVSVIVPTRNSAKFLGDCLKSIKKQTYKNIELIVVDNNSSDQTKEIARKFTDKVFNQGPERSAQRNFGVSESTGNYILIIDSDMVLSKKVIENCVEKIQERKEIKGIVIPEKSFGEGFWAECKKLERSFYLGVDWLEAARFFEKKVFNKLKGYDEHQTGTEDYDLPQRLKQKYGKSSISRIKNFIFHNEGKISLVKTCKKKFYYAKKLKQYKEDSANKENFEKQANILSRYKLFFARPRKLLQNPIIGAGMILMKTCEFAAGGIGYLFTIKKRKI